MKGVVGGILIAVGLLIAGGSGLCSLAILFDGGFTSEEMGMLPLVLIVGGIPFAAGVGLIFGGRALIRSHRRDQRPDYTSTFE